MLFDTHAHLDQVEFDADRDQVLMRARTAGVEHVVAVGVTAPSSAACVELARCYKGVHAAVGIQPNHCAESAAGDWDQIVHLAQSPGVVAVGETGLDRYWDYTPFALQQDFFARHIDLARDQDLPIVIHSRECDADILAMLRDATRRGPLRGVMHSFTGALETARECIELGLSISFAGMLTFKKSEDLRRVAACLPQEFVLVETDSPYLAPHPLRGKRNEPANLVYTAAMLAEVRGVSIEAISELTTRNAMRLFLQKT